MNLPVKTPRLAVFQANWPVQVHTYNLVKSLAQRGWGVDVYFFHCAELFEISRFATLSQTRVFNLPTGIRGWHTGGSKLRNFLKGLTRFLPLFVFQQLQQFFWQRINHSQETCPINPEQLKLVQNNLAQLPTAYQYLIGVEKEGLIWAGQLQAEIVDAALIYYSLELYTLDHPQTRSSLLRFKIKAWEAWYHQKTAKTIIQDPERGKFLLKDNGVHNSGHQIYYLPVSTEQPLLPPKTNFWQNRFPELKPTDKVILYLGGLSKSRYCGELVQIAQNFPADWKLVLHGYGEEQELNEIKALDRKQKVLFSTQPVSSEQLLDLAASAHVGLVFYRTLPMNDRLTTFASEKAALYLAAGIPLVAFDYPANLFYQQQRCGKMIHEISELPRAITRLLFKYEIYQGNARLTFDRFYDFEKNIQPFLADLEQEFQNASQK